MSVNVQGYLDYLSKPWGKLFFRMVWHRLHFEGKKILDFGSGFGVTANHLARSNDVTAIEPNEEILAHRFCENGYRQIVGGIEQLAAMPDGSYDVIVCHNVLEYLANAEERAALLREFHRLLKSNGVVSIVKHNRAGKIMQKAVFEYRVDEALDLLHGQNGRSVNLGEVHEYELDELTQDSAGLLEIDAFYGVRMFYGLQRNEVKTDSDWLANMYALECEAEEVPAFRDIAFFHHVMLKPIAEERIK